MNDLKQFYRGVHTRSVAGQGSRSNQQPQKHINATTLKSFPTFVSVVLLCALSVMAQAQGFIVTNHGGAITITGYTGAGGDVVIPSNINGLQVTRIARSAFSSRTNVTSVMIADTVETIERGAFAGCTGLTGVTLGDGLMQMEGIFLNCTALTNVAIGHRVNSIPYWEFENCPNLTAIVVDPINFAYSSLDGVLFNKGQSTLLRYPGGKPGDYVIPEAVTRIEYLAFDGCSNLTSLVMPDSVTVVRNVAFRDCTGLASVKFGSNVIEIGAGAFSGCTSLANFVLPDSVTSIKGGAFQRCTSLTSVIIPHSVTNLEGTDSWPYGLVFTGCTNLQAIVVDPLNAAYSSVDGVLFNKSQTEILEFPEGKSGGYALPQSLIVVRGGAFSGCAGLSSISMGNNVASIGASAFEGCSSLSNIVMPNSVTNIGQAAFLGCTALKRVTIPDSVIEMGSYAFSDCHGLTNVTIGNNVRTVEEFAFYNCTALTSVTIGSRVGHIASDPFYACPNLTGVYFRGNPPTVSSSAFPSKLTAYYLPDTTGWGTQLAGLPSALWLPSMHSAEMESTPENDTFAFTVSWASAQTVIVETCTNLANPTWTRLQLTILTNDSVRFHDPGWTNDSARFYRVVGVEVPADVIPVTNMVFISPGTFTMGSPLTEAGRWDDEGPQTPVTISRGFWMGRYEVTQGEYLSLMATNPSFFNGRKNGTNYGTNLSRPVEMVRWTEAVDYCAALTAQERAANRLPLGYEYRLPTEAEREYACRAGTTTPFYLGHALRSGMANFDGHFEYPPCGNSSASCTNASGIYLGRTVSVGSYPPNPWGLYDMIGNVSEWCQDWFGDYAGVPVVDPRGPATGDRRCSRGSSWLHPAPFLRSALRDYASPTYWGYFTGFRVVLAPIP